MDYEIKYVVQAPTRPYSTKEEILGLMERMSVSELLELKKEIINQINKKVNEANDH